jgi:tetratricopeptide (TPR) repeat protein
MKKKLLFNIFIYFGIFILAVLLYSNTFSHEYAYDDAIVITQNDRVQQGIDGIPSLFKNIKGAETQYRYGYRPITLTSFALDSEWFLLEPGPSHIINTLWYGLLCSLIFYFLHLLFPKNTRWTNLAITLIFVVHPLHTEVVANIKSRDEILMMFFGISSAIFFLKYLIVTKHRWIWSLATILAVLLSFLSRENGLVFGGIILLISFLKYTKQQNSLKDAFWIPAVIILILISVRLGSYSDFIFTDNTLTLSKQGTFLEEGFLGNPITDLSSVFDILPNTFFILLRYLSLLAYPHPLVHDYGFGYSYLVGWNNLWVWTSVLIHLGIVYYIVKTYKKWGLIQIGMLFYFITIALFLHIVRVTPDYMAERYLFVPSLGFAMIVIGCTNKLIHWLQKRLTKRNIFILNTVTTILFVILLTISCTLTRNRNMAWKNNATLFKADSKALTNSARFNYNYGLEIYQANPNTKSQTVQDSILFQFEKSIAISKRSYRIQLEYGKKLIEFGRSKQAVDVFEELINSHPKKAGAYLALYTSLFEQKKYEELIEKAENGKTKGLRHPDIIYLEGAALVQINRPQEALKVLRQGLILKPRESVYFNLLSDLEYFMGDKTIAKAHLHKALNLSPTNKEIKMKIKTRYSN